jgi:probable F420-dependent oxidoreductase
MRVGFNLPNIGPLGSAESVAKVARRAEELGYDSLWVIERLLYPVKPQDPYPGTPDGHLPEEYQHALDPLETLTFAAAHTSRIALGTSVLDMPYYNPVMLARRATTLDVLSGGRLRLGMGLGWSHDEYEASGATFKNRGARADEFLAVLKAVWTTDPVEFHGEFFHVPKSVIQPKPVQKPHPPIYLAAFGPGALARLARMADGWNPVGVPPDQMTAIMSDLQRQAKEAGRDPAALALITRGNLEISDRPAGANRWPFQGTFEQIRGDAEAMRKAGADELILDVTFSRGGQSLSTVLGWMEKLRGMV